jgi:Transglutaminase-like superfamily
LDRSVAAVCLGLALALPARADDLVLHEHVAAPGKPHSRVVRGSLPGEGKPPANPTAIRQDEKIIAAPSVSQPPTGSEVIHGQRSFAADRETEAHLDYATQQDGTLHYVEVFNPSIVPFKRMSALDRVRPDFTLEGAGRDLRAISVGGQTTSDRDLFWGSLVVDLPDGGAQVPIPSVAPDMRILSYEAQPRARLAFARDAADNFYLRAEEGAHGQHRIVILVDAPAVYFAPKVPTGIPLRDVARKRPPLPLPERVRASATTMLGRLGISSDLSADRAVSRMVDYFRGFEAGVPPSPSGDIYLDLALSKKGVCRHRAFAFMITANAAGIPTRYVTNEAHAFAEIWMPGPGWLRIDLGGAAMELDVANEGDKTLYRPRGEDPFPKPRAYAENYTRLRGGVSGLSSQQIGEARGHSSAPPAESAPGAEPGRDPRSTEPITAPTQRLPHPRGEAIPGKRPLSLVVDSIDKSGYRGEAVRVTGHAGGTLGPPAGLRVDVYLAPAGSEGDGARIIGQAITDDHGAFSLIAALPLDLGLGEHEVYALSSGNDVYSPAISE